MVAGRVISLRSDLSCQEQQVCESDMASDAAAAAFTSSNLDAAMPRLYCSVKGECFTFDKAV